jgi:ABC-type multidrug transport system fused ATPase/permease subunit
MRRRVPHCASFLRTTVLTVASQVLLNVSVSLLGRRMAGLTFLSACAWNAVRVLADWWIVYLITGTFFASLNAFVFSWLGLTLGCVVLLLLQGTLFVRASANAGQRLHDRVFFTVLAAPMSWFDVTPVGRVTNRLAKDLDAVDKLLPYSLDQFLQCILQCIAVVILIAVALPWFLIALPFIFALFVLLSNFFRRSSTQLRRIDGIVGGKSHDSLAGQRAHVCRTAGGAVRRVALVTLCFLVHDALLLASVGRCDLCCDSLRHNHLCVAAQRFSRFCCGGRSCSKV